MFVKKILTSLAFAAGSLGAGQALCATFFSEDFSSNTLGANVSAIIGALPSTATGAVSFSSVGYVGTNDADYHTASFLAEITVDPTSTTGQLYFGLGKGSYLPDPGDNFGNPASGPVAYIRHFQPGALNNLTIATNDENNAGLTPGGGMGEISNVGGVGPGMGAYKLGLRYLAGTSFLQVLINDIEYAPGGVDLSGYDFAGDGRIFFGGTGGTFDNFSVTAIADVPLPAGMGLLLSAMAGFGVICARRKARAAA